MCFVTGLEEEEFISSDSMSKLRQVSSDFCFYQTYTVKKSFAFCCELMSDSSLNEREVLARLHEYPNLTSSKRFFHFFFTFAEKSKHSANS